jgi:hypothetical protein
VPQRPTLAVDFDFDGVVHEYSLGWNGGALGAPMPGARDALIRLSRTFRLVLFTARHDLEAVTQWLIAQRMEHLFADVTNRKPAAEYYLDDRALKFVSWEQALHDLT